MNLLSAAALQEIESAFAAVSDSKLILFRSARSHIFAAGADMAEMQKFGAAEADRFSRLGQRVFEGVERSEALTVALIDGDCYGGALDLALAFDFRFATARSRFSHPGARIGIVTGFGGTERLPRRGGRALTVKALLSNEVLTAADAVSHGLVDRMFDDFDGSELTAAMRLTSRRTVEVDIAKRISRQGRRLSAAQLQTIARRTESLLRGSRLDGRH